jgi:multiple sugar transport system permease protein
VSPAEYGPLRADERIVLAGGVVAFVPVVAILVFCQKYCFRGFEEGGVKF